MGLNNVKAPTDRIRVKVLSRVKEAAWLRQLPGALPQWGLCDFEFDPDCKDYDWLVVYDELPPMQGERFPTRKEILPCPQRNTLLVTTEPSTIKSYGKAYASQFGYVLTSQEEWALPHSGRIFSQPALQWFYGLGLESGLRSYDDMVAHPPLEKTKMIGTVCSVKQQKHTLHNQRYQFTQSLRGRFPEMDVYGRGVIPMNDKAQSLDDYRYHIAIENFIGPHHWTEKLSDSFLGVTLPFYSGATNAAEYFPENSFIPIDIMDLDASTETIKQALQDNLFEKRLPDILEARRRVLEEYNFFPVIARIIEEHYAPHANEPIGDAILARRAIAKSSLANGLRHLYEKTRLRTLHRFKH